MHAMTLSQVLYACALKNFTISVIKIYGLRLILRPEARYLLRWIIKPWTHTSMTSQICQLTGNKTVKRHPFPQAVSVQVSMCPIGLYDRVQTEGHFKIMIPGIKFLFYFAHYPFS